MKTNKLKRVWVDDAPGLDISSLIDVCFLLLIYFLIATTIQRNEQDVNMRLPGIPQAAVPELDGITPMFIKVNQKGAIYIGTSDNAVLMDSDLDDRLVPNLSRELETYSAACKLTGDNPMLQIKIAPDVTQQRVLDVLNSVSKYGIKHVTFTDYEE